MKIRVNKIVGFVMAFIVMISSFMLVSKVQAQQNEYDIIISSVVKGNAEELSGARFSIKDSTNTNILMSWDSGNAPHTVKLKSGKYVLVEEIAPNGYQPEVSQREFLVFDDGSLRLIEGASSSFVPNSTIVFNHILVGFDVKISNISEDNTEELPGVLLDLSKQSGELIHSWTTTDHMEVIRLLPGQYRLTVQRGLQGYAPTDGIDFEVSINGEISRSINGETKVVDFVQVVNELMKYDVFISKMEKGQNSELRNAKLVVKKISNNTETEIAQWITTKHPQKLKLTKGEYKLEEIEAPIGYELAQPILFRLSIDGLLEKKEGDQWVVVNNSTIQMFNHLKKHLVVISSVEEDKDIELSGTQLVIKEKNTSQIIENITTTDTKKQLMLFPGRYIAEEIQAPFGYEKASSVEFLVGPDSSVHILSGNVGLEVTDKMVQLVHNLKKHDVVFSSIAQDKNGELASAKLRIIRQDGSIQDEWDTTETAKILSLEPNQYTLEEVKAPNGYSLAKAMVFRLNLDGSIELQENGQWNLLLNAQLQMVHKPKPKMNPAPVPQPKPNAQVKPIVNEKTKITSSFHIPKTMDTTDVLIWFTLLYTSLLALVLLLNIQKSK